MLIGNGHGLAPGKRSPDGKFLEATYTREIARRVVADLIAECFYTAVLTENFFMDNLSDLEYLQSRVGKQAAVDTHVEGIIDYLFT